jgi:prenyltransferase beta subunit
MRKLWSCIAFFIISFGSINLAIANDTKAIRDYDWGKTQNLIEDWSKRPNFPDSISFAYYYVYSKRALNLNIEENERKKLLNFIKRCQTKDGGFVSEPKFDKDSSIISSFYAIKTLDILKETKLVNKESLTAFLRSMFTKDGGMRLSSNTKEASLAGTALGVVLLGRLITLSNQEKISAKAYILKYKAPDGGFGLFNNNVSSIRATAMATAALKSMKAIKDIDKEDIAGFLKKSRYSGLVTGEKFKTLPSMEEMAQFLATARLLGPVDKKITDSKKISEFIRSLYITENGGFGPEPGLGTTPPSTFYGLFSLVQLGQLRPVDLTGLTGFFSF